MFVVVLSLRLCRAINGSSLNSEIEERRWNFAAALVFLFFFSNPLLSTDGGVQLCEVSGERTRRRSWWWRRRREGGGDLRWIDTSRLKLTGADSRVQRDSLYWWWSQPTEHSRNFSNLRDGGRDRLGESKSLCLYFHPSLWTSLCAGSLVVATTPQAARRCLYYFILFYFISLVEHQYVQYLTLMLCQNLLSGKKVKKTKLKANHHADRHQRIHCYKLTAVLQN